MSKFIAFASRLAIVAVPLALAGVGAPAVAGQVGSDKDAQLAQSQVGGYSQEQLESYVAAVKQVQRIDEAWQPRMTQAETPEEIENQGLTVAEYNEITRAAETDQQLYDHILTLLAQAPQ